MADIPGKQPGGGRRRWTRTEYGRMSDLGLLGDARTELLAGDVWHVPPPSPRCYTAIVLADRLLKTACGSTYSTRQRGPVVLSDESEPEPAVVVVAGSPRLYDDHHPSPIEIQLLVEVSEVRLGRNRGIKMRLYATAGIREYWIINVSERQLEVHRDPALLTRGYDFKSRQVLVEGDRVSPLFAPDSVVAVAGLFPVPVSEEENTALTKTNP